MAQRGRPPLPRGVLAFDAPDWEPPKAVVLDTNVVAEALLPNQPEHAACRTLLRQFAEESTAVVFNRLLEIELWEVVFNLALRERHPRKNIRHVRYDNRVRPRAARLLRQAHQAWEDDLLAPLTWSRIEMHEIAENVPKLMQEYGFQSYDAVHAATLLASEVTDFVTRDGGFAVLPPAIATLHTTHARLAGTRGRRRRAGH
jgi:predicted nucleic acid-binding protein